DGSANTGFLTATTITGLGLGLGVNYTAIATLRIDLGSGSDTFNIQSTNAATTTTLTTRVGGTNTINFGSNAPGTGGTVNNIAGTVDVHGNGRDTINVDDSGDTSSNTGLLLSDAFSGLGPAEVGFWGIAAINISLGSGDDSFSVWELNPLT